MLFRAHLLTGAAIASLTFASDPAFGQVTASADPTIGGSAAPNQTTPEADADLQSGEVIVTAQKRAENVQRVPLAVSVVTPAQLAVSGVTQFQDLGKIAPSLVVRPADQPGSANVSLRGVGTFAFGIGVESSVAVLVDEVPLAFQARAFTDLPDVERIEVLRGPQSSLYGKSASAGLINIITRNPTSTMRVHANVLATTDDEYGANASVSGPLSSTLGYVVSGSYSDWKGNVRNRFNGDAANGRENGNARAKLRWTPSSEASITLAANYAEGRTKVGIPYIRFGAGALLRNVPGLTPGIVLPGVSVGAANQEISNNYPSRTRYRAYGGHLRSEIGLGRHTLVAISSYDHYNLVDKIDNDTTASSASVGNNVSLGQFTSRLATHEVRLLSPGDQPFRYTLGAYYANVHFRRPLDRGPAFSLANWRATSRSTQIAGFAQLDWEIVPKLTLTAGGRVQNEKIGYTYRDILNGNAFFRGADNDTAGTYRFSGRYQFTPDLMAFATYATGYKGQTYDLTTGFNTNRALAGPIKPERARDKEMGLRAQLFDRRVTANLTLFNTTYKNLQAQSIETLADGSTNFRLTNVGRLRSRGVEFEGSARLGSDLSLTGSATYLGATYTSFPVAQCYPLQTAAQGCTGTPARQNLTGQRAVQSPKWKLNAGADYSPLLSTGLRGIAQANWQYQSDIYYVAEDPQTFQKAYSVVNIGLGVGGDNRRWQAVLFVNNLFDKQYYSALTNSAGLFGNQVATQAILPRDFRRYGGLRLSFNY